MSQNMKPAEVSLVITPREKWLTQGSSSLLMPRGRVRRRNAELSFWIKVKRKTIYDHDFWENKETNTELDQ